MMTWILAAATELGAGLALTSAIRIIQDGGRIAAIAYFVIGLGVALFGAGFLEWTYSRDTPEAGRLAETRGPHEV